MRANIRGACFVRALLFAAGLLAAEVLLYAACVTAYAGASKEYDFSQDWTSDKVRVWQGPLEPFQGKPSIRYLEIGAFEGRTTIWMLENIFTHSSARATCIDNFMHSKKETLLHNLAQSGFAHKVKVISGRSQVALKSLPEESFDVVYIDGSHVARDVLVDAVLSWQLLKTGGLIIFDDYLYGAGVFPDELRPQVAIDAFITAYRNNLEVLVHDYMVILRKKSDMVWFLTLGKYWYNWWDKELYLTGTEKPVSFSDGEKKIIEQLFLERKFGETGFTLNNEQSQRVDFIKLTERLGFDAKK